MFWGGGARGGGCLGQSSGSGFRVGWVKGLAYRAWVTRRIMGLSGVSFLVP